MRVEKQYFNNGINNKYTQQAWRLLHKGCKIRI